MTEKECALKLEELVDSASSLLDSINNHPKLKLLTVKGNFEENLYAVVSYKIGRILATYFKVDEELEDVRSLPDPSPPRILN